MFSAYENSLYFKSKERFKEIENATKKFNVLYNGDNIIQDDIFSVLKNCSEQNNFPLEIFRYPVNDKEFCACTFIRDGRIFVLINTAMQLSKQIFAAAHELYHIWYFFEEDNITLLKHGSVLKSNVIDEDATEIEDIEANAFAGLLLAPESAIRNQMSVYGIENKSIAFKDVLKLMDIFAIPYKAMILRLFEVGILSDAEVRELFLRTTEDVNKAIELTNLGKRWMNTSQDDLVLGSLRELLYENEKYDLITEERHQNDSMRLNELTQKLQRGK